MPGCGSALSQFHGRPPALRRTESSYSKGQASRRVGHPPCSSSSLGLRELEMARAVRNSGPRNARNLDISVEVGMAMGAGNRSRPSCLLCFFFVDRLPVLARSVPLLFSPSFTSRSLSLKCALMRDLSRPVGGHAPLAHVGGGERRT